MQRSSGGAAIVVTILVLLVFAPLLYVASVGPAVWFVERGLVSAEPDSVIVVFYSPLEFVAQNSNSAQITLD
jgi:hypothetical protein